MADIDWAGFEDEAATIIADTVIEANRLSWHSLYSEEARQSRLGLLCGIALVGGALEGRVDAAVAAIVAREAPWAAPRLRRVVRLFH